MSVPITDLCIAAPFEVIPYVLTDTDGPLGPNLGDRVVFRSVANPALNSSGSIVFSGVIEGPDIQGTNNQGIWTASASPQSATVVARTGTARELGPGIGPGNVFDSFRAPFLSEGGDVTFHAFAQQGGVGSPESWDGIWRIPAGQSPFALSITGDDDVMGPGLGDGIAFRIIDGTFNNDLPWASVDNDIVFLGILEGRGIDATNNIGLWKSDAMQPATAIAIEGHDGLLGHPCEAVIACFLFCGVGVI